eukprot:2711581-Pleurochrysis_carterae.AAC.1
MRRPCPDQKIRARLAHSFSGPCLHLQLGSVGGPHRSQIGRSTHSCQKARVRIVPHLQQAS